MVVLACEWLRSMTMKGATGRRFTSLSGLTSVCRYKEQVVPFQGTEIVDLEVQ
jgi:hypothetical protein